MKSDTRPKRLLSRRRQAGKNSYPLQNALVFLLLFVATAVPAAASTVSGTVFRDFDGDGTIDIAYVDRPHLAKTIRVFAYDGGLTEVGQIAGYSNHRIGEDFISGGVRDCGQGPELIVARGDWSGMVALRFDGSGFTETPLGHDISPSAFAAALAC